MKLISNDNRVAEHKINVQISPAFYTSNGNMEFTLKTHYHLYYYPISVNHLDRNSAR